MKKQILTLALVAATTLAALPSQALVRLIVRCQTADGQYLVSVTGNQGTGIVRLAVYGAQIYNSEGTLLSSYTVHQKTTQSASFGRHDYVDLKSEGQQFDLAFPSTNYHSTDLKAVLGDGTVIQEKGLTCSNH
jgi:hypothetical protein